MQNEKCINCGQVGLFATQPRGDTTRDCVCGMTYHFCHVHSHNMVHGPYPSGNRCSCQVPVGSCPTCNTHVDRIQHHYDGTFTCPRCSAQFHMCEKHPMNVVMGASHGALTYRECSCGADKASAGVHEQHRSSHLGGAHHEIHGNQAGRAGV